MPALRENKGNPHKPLELFVHIDERRDAQLDRALSGMAPLASHPFLRDHVKDVLGRIGASELESLGRNLHGQEGTRGVGVSILAYLSENRHEELGAGRTQELRSLLAGEDHRHVEEYEHTLHQYLEIRSNGFFLDEGRKVVAQDATEEVKKGGLRMDLILGGEEDKPSYYVTGVGAGSVSFFEIGPGGDSAKMTVADSDRLMQLVTGGGYRAYQVTDGRGRYYTDVVENRQRFMWDPLDSERDLGLTRAAAAGLNRGEKVRDAALDLDLMGERLLIAAGREESKYQQPRCRLLTDVEKDPRGDGYLRLTNVRVAEILGPNGSVTPIGIKTLLDSLNGETLVCRSAESRSKPALLTREISPHLRGYDITERIGSEGFSPGMVITGSDERISYGVEYPKPVAYIAGKSGDTFDVLAFEADGVKRYRNMRAEDLKALVEAGSGRRVYQPLDINQHTMERSRGRLARREMTEELVLGMDDEIRRRLDSGNTVRLRLKGFVDNSGEICSVGPATRRSVWDNSGFDASVELKKSGAGTYTVSKFELERITHGNITLNQAIHLVGSFEDHQVSVPEKYAGSYVPSAAEKNDLGTDYEGRARHFNVRMDGETLCCRRLNAQEVDPEYLNRLKGMEIEREADFGQVRFPNATGWRGRYLGGGEEKDIFLVVDDKNRAFSMVFRDLESAKINHHGTDDFYSIGSVATTVKVKGELGEKTVIRGFQVREYEHGYSGGEIPFIEGAKGWRMRSLNAVASIPHRLVGSFMAYWERKKVLDSPHAHYRPEETHSGNFMVVESDRRVDEFGRKYRIPLPVIRKGKDGRSGLTLRWYDTRALELTEY
ncbi:MAG: hypothetical protein V1875_01955 [Candidatus Altiarchaeota archaeon]